MRTRVCAAVMLVVIALAALLHGSGQQSRTPQEVQLSSPVEKPEQAPPPPPDDAPPR